MPITLVVDPGHGGDRPVGGSSPYGGRGPSGALEKSVTLALAQRIRDRADGDVRVLLTRDGDHNLSLAERAELGRRAGADAFLSIHANHGRADRRGAEVYVRPDGTPSSHQLADCLCDQLGDRQSRPEPPQAADLAVLDPRRVGNAAAVLLEVDWLSNPDGERRLRSGRRLDDLADRVLGAVRRWGQWVPVPWAHQSQGGTFPRPNYPTQPPSSGGEAPPQPYPPPQPPPPVVPVPACPALVYFAYDSDVVDESTYGGVMDQMAAWLRANPGELAQINGHADPDNHTGDPSYNDRLGQRRAEAVAQALLRRGVPGGQLGVSSAGSRSPVSGGDPARYHLDRRAVINCRASYGRTVAHAYDVVGTAVPSAIYFGQGSAEISGDEAAKLQRVADYAQANPMDTLSLLGYSDSMEALLDPHLAAARAGAVADQLVRLGVRRDRLSVSPSRSPGAPLPGPSSTSASERRVDIVTSGATPLIPGGTGAIPL